ncbi:MAG: hypothetical protein U0R65_02255 [Candidatus Nanopelagicales bacterium]
MGEGGRAPRQGKEVVDGPVVDGDRGHDLLGEDVQRRAGDPQLLDPTLAHARSVTTAA